MVAVSHTTPPQAAASQSPTAATRSMTAKYMVAACQAVELTSKAENGPCPTPTMSAQ